LLLQIPKTCIFRATLRPVVGSLQGQALLELRDGLKFLAGPRVDVEEAGVRAGQIGIGMRELEILLRRGVVLAGEVVHQSDVRFSFRRERVKFGGALPHVSANNALGEQTTNTRSSDGRTNGRSSTREAGCIDT